jgi:hypothetical protein
MLTLRRFLVLAALMFWQGGFTFYASVVVPVGQAALGHAGQGAITRQVTNYLNLSGAAALVILAWDVALAGDPSLTRQRLRWLAWGAMALTLGALAWFHVQLDGLLDQRASSGMDRDAFKRVHSVYLWISTLQWAFAGWYAILSLRTWRSVDGWTAANTADTHLQAGVPQNVG